MIVRLDVSSLSRKVIGVEESRYDERFHPLWTCSGASGATHGLRRVVVPRACREHWKSSVALFKSPKTCSVSALVPPHHDYYHVRGGRSPSSMWEYDPLFCSSSVVKRHRDDVQVKPDRPLKPQA